MYKNYFKVLFLTLFSFFTFSLSAQSSCDKLFSNGVRYQQTMTISSQNNAIALFEKAKACYDSQAKKDLCDQQIRACKNIIAQINKTNNLIKKEAEAAEVAEQQKVEKVDTVVTVVPEVRKDIVLTLDLSYLKFKGKGGEFKKIKVTCNYPDWKIVSNLSWVKCSRNDNSEIVVEVDENPTKSERSGNITVECDNVSATFTIIQDKIKKFGLF